MNILITGASGFIGSNLAEYLKARGNYVIGVYNSRIPESAMDAMIQCDLSQADLEACFGNIKMDAIVHLAGQMKGNRICDYLDHTVNATRKLLRYAEKRRVAGFIYISSIAVYGETNFAVNEESDRINLNDYGNTKYICERMVEDSSILSRIVIRQPRTLGKGCDLSYPWLPKVADQMLRSETVYYTNPDLMYNNLLYVDDFSDFILRILQTDMNGFHRFVLGAKTKMRVLDILQCMKENLNSSSELIERTSEKKNTCYAIETSYAESYGFQPRTAEEAIVRFCRDLIGENNKLCKKL